jgi:ketosteroid isomerase-like protein
MKTKAHENAKLVKRFYRNAHRGEYVQANEFLSSDIEYLDRIQPPLGFSTEHKGAAAVLAETIGPMTDKLVEYRLKINKVFGVGDNVLVLGHIQGLSTETIQNLNAPVAQIWTLQDGKAVRFEAIHDLDAWRVTVPEPERLAA